MPQMLPLLATDDAACCTTVTGSVISVEDAEHTARVFKALGDATRVRLLSLIAASSDARRASATSPSPSDCPSRPSRTT